ARVHPQVKMNFLMSPMLVVAYALIGRVDVNLMEDPLSYDPNGNPIYLKDIWPTQEEINQTIQEAMRKEDFEEVYDDLFDGVEEWKKLAAPQGKEFIWDDASTYMREVHFFKDLPTEPVEHTEVEHSRALLVSGDSTTFEL